MIEVLANSPDLVGAYVFFLGLCIGSFLNVVAYRLPVMMKQQWRHDCCELLDQPCNDVSTEPFNLMFPASRCPHCGHQIRWWENIPVIGWVTLRGRCSSCKKPISPRYPIVELGTGLLSLLTISVVGISWAGAFALVATWALIALTLIDLDEQLLPDDITLPLLWLGLAVNTAGTFAPLESAVIGAIAGYLSLWIVYWAFKLLTGKEGMGYGDFKLLAALGAWLGWQMLPAIILISSLAGAVIGIALLAIRRQSTQFAFGPYLAIAGYIALLWHAPILTWYLGG